MDKLQNKIIKFSASAIFIATILTGSQTLAQTTLTGLEISASNTRGYDIVLNTDKDTVINKKNITPDSLELNLKNTKLSKNTNTIYKNADGIEHVILKPKANDLKIEISGDSAERSNVALVATPENTVVINKPLSAYAPIHQLEEEPVIKSFSFISFLRNIKNSQTLRSLLNSENLGWVVSFVMMFGVLIAANNRNRKRSQVSVSISNKAEDTENKLLKSALERKEGLIAQGTGARRTSLMQPKPQPKATNLQNTNYGLKAYNSTPKQNTTNLSLRSKNVPMNRTELSDIQPINSIPARRPLSTATSQELKNDIRKTEVQIDNVKFLESMAKIYERSGRVDLANGLANNIKKAKNKR